MINIVHLFPDQLGLNGERGNVECLQSRLGWAGVESSIHEVSSMAQMPESVDALFIGSGTLSGALEALAKMQPFSERLKVLANAGTPMLALGLGWEILGREITLLDGKTVPGLGIYPSHSRRIEKRASCEAFGYDQAGNLCVGYANHSAEITLLEDSEPLIQLEVGFGNSSITKASGAPAEGLLSGNLMAARLNGPLLPLNPHLADAFLGMMAKNSNFSYVQQSDQAREVDELASNARIALQKRLLSQ
jgi:CobQ-like glutamine amidotransferase family enzyme